MFNQKSNFYRNYGINKELNDEWDELNDEIWVCFNSFILFIIYHLFY